MNQIKSLFIRVAIVLLLLSAFFIQAAPAGEPSRKMTIGFLVEDKDSKSSAPMYPHREHQSGPVINLPPVVYEPNNPGNVDRLPQPDIIPQRYTHQVGEPNLDQLSMGLSQKLENLNQVWREMSDEQRKAKPFWKSLASEAQKELDTANTAYQVLLALLLQEASMQHEIDATGIMTYATVRVRLSIFQDKIASLERKSNAEKLGEKIRARILRYVRTHTKTAKILWNEKSGKLDQLSEDVDKIVTRLSIPAVASVTSGDSKPVWEKIVDAAFWQIKTVTLKYNSEDDPPSSYELLLALLLLQRGTEEQVANSDKAVFRGTLKGRWERSKELVDQYLGNDGEALMRGNTIVLQLQRVSDQIRKTKKPAPVQGAVYSYLDSDEARPSKRMRD